MLARIWHGRTTTSASDDYLQFLKKRAIPDYQATEGNQGVYILRRIEGDQTHFLTLTFWESREALQRFAGVEIEKAKGTSGNKMIMVFEA